MSDTREGTKLYTGCDRCLRPYESKDPATGAVVPALSRSPLCFHCLAQGSDNAEFHAALAGKLSASHQ